MDDTATFLAAFFEFGLPLALVVLAVKLRSIRHLVIPALGGVSPFTLFMVYGLFDYYLSGQPQGSMFLAGFFMGLAFYILSAIIGFIVGFLAPKNINMFIRYVAGFIIGPTGAYLLVSVI